MFIETYIGLAILAVLVPIALWMQAQRAYNERRRLIRIEQRNELLKAESERGRPVMTFHLQDEHFFWPACGQEHHNIAVTGDVAQVTCGCCKRTAQYAEAQREAIIERSTVPLSNEALEALARFILARIAGTPQEPSEKQVEAASWAFNRSADAPANHHVVVKGEMDEDGTMLVAMTEDGATQHGRFKRDGRLEGDWF